MLAGKMKLRNFLMLVGIVAMAGVVALIVLGGRKKEADDADVMRDHSAAAAERRQAELAELRAQTEAAARAKAAAEAAAQAPATPVDHVAERAHDPVVLAWQGKTIKGDKEKDVSKGRPYKVSIYRDKGQTTVNRAKVDLDRDDKWDEKYTFDGTTVTLQRAPADDEKYTETLVWSGTGWRDPTKAEAPAGAPTPAGDTGGVAVESKTQPDRIDLGERGHDKAVLGWQGKRLSSDKEKDVSKGTPYKINVYQDAGETTVNRVKVDLDRDDKFDEKYTFDGSKVTLQRAPADDEQYSETFVWSGAGWLKP